MCLIVLLWSSGFDLVAKSVCLSSNLSAACLTPGPTQWSWKAAVVTESILIYRCVLSKRPFLVLHQALLLLQEGHLTGTVQYQNPPEAPHLVAGQGNDTAEAAGLHHEVAAAPLGNDATSTRTCTCTRDPSPSQRVTSQVSTLCEA